jgi:hypothetical protein
MSYQLDPTNAMAKIAPSMIVGVVALLAAMLF